MGKFDASAYRDIELVLLAHGVYKALGPQACLKHNILVISVFSGTADKAHEVLDSYVEQGIFEAKRVRAFMDHVHDLIH